MKIRVSLAAPQELEACQALRRSVFVEGLDVPEEIEIDGRDPECTHFVARSEQGIVGTARLREVDGAAKAERVAVLAEARGLGVGKALMRALEREAARRGLPKVTLHAQQQAIPFYEAIGYTGEGPVFEEAGIPHREMWRATGA